MRIYELYLMSVKIQWGNTEAHLPDLAGVHGSP